MPEKTGQFNQQSAIRIGKATRYVESLRRNDPNPSITRNLTEDFYLGKPDQDLESGPLTGDGETGAGTGTEGGGNIVSIWLGPAWGVEDDDTGLDIEADYALQDFLAGEYVTVTRYKGKWYVGCLFSEPGTGT